MKKNFTFLAGLIVASLPGIMSASMQASPKNSSDNDNSINGYYLFDSMIKSWTWKYADIDIDTNWWDDYYPGKENDKPTSSLRGLMRARFNGTIEIDGKEYHKFTATYASAMSDVRRYNGLEGRYRYVKKRKDEYSDMHKYATAEPFTDYSEVDLAYIREIDEGEKYAMLHAPENGEKAWYLNEDYGSEKYESLIYDFRPSEGSVVDQLQFCDDSAYRDMISAPYSMPYYSYSSYTDRPNYNYIDGTATVTLEELGFKNIPDYVLKKERVCQYTRRGTFVEGIGIISTGNPVYFHNDLASEVLAFPGGARKEAGPEGTNRHIMLNRIFNRNGEVIYEAPGFIDASAGISGAAAVTEGISMDYSNGMLRAAASESIALDIFSSDGRLILSVNSSDGLIEKDLGNLQPGIYVARCRTAASGKSLKICVR